MRVIGRMHLLWGCDVMLSIWIWVMWHIASMWRVVFPIRFVADATARLVVAAAGAMYYMLRVLAWGRSWAVWSKCRASIAFWKRQLDRHGVVGVVFRVSRYWFRRMRVWWWRRCVMPVVCRLVYVCLSGLRWSRRQRRLLYSRIVYGVSLQIVLAMCHTTDWCTQLVFITGIASAVALGCVALVRSHWAHNTAITTSALTRRMLTLCTRWFFSAVPTIIKVLWLGGLVWKICTILF